jgi:hypothetical protein
MSCSRNLTRANCVDLVCKMYAQGVGQDARGEGAEARDQMGEGVKAGDLMD